MGYFIMEPHFKKATTQKRSNFPFQEELAGSPSYVFSQGKIERIPQAQKTIVP
jgi:hypothetical protein